ncbi:Alkaline ceramidase YPC1 [Nakaseomyces bracarensis]|uniref:Alkaline ceramidase YPC1 n=1 Tax=Nakaseomyces bracarensis TaxID=273131 RepID=A0ABR4P1M2_9SACH
MFRWEYPSGGEGFWGPVTSTIDWCEENYVVSHYVAEWSNTVTNTIFIMSALYTIYCVLRNRFETRFLLIGLTYCLVGVGSWLFHMTLKYRFQLLDELPMIYAMCVPCWSLITEIFETFTDNSGPLSRFKQVFIASLILATTSGVTVVYLIVKNATIHQAFFGCLIGVVAFSSAYMVINYVKDPIQKKNLYHSMIMGATFFMSGYAVWLMDIHLCSLWRFIRREYLLLPLGLLLELHGWWHVLTGLGIYYYIVYLEYLRLITTEHLDDYLFIWRYGFVPELVPADHKICTKYSLTFRGPYVKSKND